MGNLRPCRSCSIFLLKRRKWSVVRRIQIRGWKKMGQRAYQNVHHSPTQSKWHHLPQQALREWSQMVSGKSKRVNPHPTRTKINTLTNTIIWGWIQGEIQGWRWKNRTAINHNSNSSAKSTPAPRVELATSTMIATPKKWPTPRIVSP